MGRNESRVERFGVGDLNELTLSATTSVNVHAVFGA